MAPKADFCPKLLPNLLIGSDPKLLAPVISALAKKRCYLTVFNEAQPPSADEIIWRHAIEVKMNPKQVIFVDTDKSFIKKLKISSDKIIEIKFLDDLYQSDLSPELRNLEYFDWGQKNIAIGLLLALREGKVLRLIAGGPNATEVPTQSGHFVVCEGEEEFLTLQAANYAYSIGAGLKIIPSYPIKKSREILERLYSSDERSEWQTESPTTIIGNVATEMRQIIGAIPSNVDSLTFITSRVPWGLGFPEKPTTHLFAETDLGLQIMLGVLHEQKNTPGIQVLAVIEPGQVKASEVDFVIQEMYLKKTLIREYQGPHASLEIITDVIELLPYDLLYISSHCKDAGGWRHTYNFEDSKGVAHELITEVAASPIPITGSDVVSITIAQHPIMLNGIDLDEPGFKTAEVEAILDEWRALTDPNNPILEPTSTIEIKRVRGVPAISLYNNQQFLWSPFRLASHNAPIVINNACVSWHKLAQTCTLMNARSYLGTLFPVSETEVDEITKLLFKRYFGRPLSVALWHAQNKVYGSSSRRPYILSGTHFQRLRTIPDDKIDHLGVQLVQLHNQYLGLLQRGHVPSYLVPAWQEKINFLKMEINVLRDGAKDLSHRQLPDRKEINQLG
jgi:hypothetical protein